MIQSIIVWFFIHSGFHPSFLISSAAESKVHLNSKYYTYKFLHLFMSSAVELKKRWKPRNQLQFFFSFILIFRLFSKQIRTVLVSSSEATVRIFQGGIILLAPDELIGKIKFEKANVSQRSKWKTQKTYSIWFSCSILLFWIS